MLKSVINIRENVDRKNGGFKPKKSNVLTIEQVDQFLREALGDKYLVMKVALIAGVAGACRGKELVDLEVNDVRDMGDLFLITVRNTKNKVDRNFVIKNSENIISFFRDFPSLFDPGGIKCDTFSPYQNRVKLLLHYRKCEKG
ncbi:hypothetical protein NQ317_011101 [Molorchus minor]|uniref:Tyr recombinase domain-containing protein n=1 Tax=Molorchus minor TaxID=1323400 RepID=A0ABQ9K271_9CUCU|nr:hypothetical protein NQ317_011101 [Molorchus minor]